jgi:hypothetical protein
MEERRRESSLVDEALRR